jgi:hypothetical protein
MIALITQARVNDMRLGLVSEMGFIVVFGLKRITHTGSECKE